VSKGVIRPRHGEKIIGRPCQRRFFTFAIPGTAGRGNGISGFVMVCAEKRNTERMIMMSSLTCAILYYAPSQSTKYQPHILLASKGLLFLRAK
jgi:hypothetical protein